MACPASGVAGLRLKFTPLEPDPVAPWLEQRPIEALPQEVLLFLLGSRYCETDLLSETAWDLFGAAPTGWKRVQAICDFVHQHIQFGYNLAGTQAVISVLKQRADVTDGPPNLWTASTMFYAAYATLLHHVEHMADFHRLPTEIEDEGFEFLQTYLKKEEKPTEPILQDVFDTLAESLNVATSLDDDKLFERPNLIHFQQAMLELQKSVYPVSDFEKSAKVTLDQMECGCYCRAFRFRFSFAARFALAFRELRVNEPPSCCVRLD